jgi:hypothetical protein
MEGEGEMAGREPEDLESRDRGQGNGIEREQEEGRARAFICSWCVCVFALGQCEDS